MDLTPRKKSSLKTFIYLLEFNFSGANYSFYVLKRARCLFDSKIKMTEKVLRRKDLFFYLSFQDYLISQFWLNNYVSTTSMVPFCDTFKAKMKKVSKYISNKKKWLFIYQRLGLIYRRRCSDKPSSLLNALEFNRI